MPLSWNEVRSRAAPLPKTGKMQPTKTAKCFQIFWMLIIRRPWFGQTRLITASWVDRALKETGYESRMQEQGRRYHPPSVLPKDEIGNGPGSVLEWNMSLDR